MSLPENKTLRIIQNIKESLKSILLIGLSLYVFAATFLDSVPTINVNGSSQKVNFARSTTAVFDNMSVSNIGYANDSKTNVTPFAQQYYRNSIPPAPGQPNRLGKGFIMTSDMIHQMSRAYDHYANNSANPRKIGGFHMYYADTNGPNTNGGEAVVFYPLNLNLDEYALNNSEQLYYLNVPLKVAAPCPELCDDSALVWQQYNLY